MKKIISLAFVASACAAPAVAQTAVSGQYRQTPPTLSDGQQQQIRLDPNGAVVTTSVDASGAPAGGATAASQGSTTAGQSGTLAMGTVVTGDQTYTVGTTRPLNLTPNGRLKVGLSSATGIDPAAQLTTTLAADLHACKYYATPPTWSDGFTGAVQCNNAGALRIDNTTLSPGAASAANQVTMIANQTATGTSSQRVQGNIARATANVGDPVLTGCVYRLGGAVTSGQRADCTSDNNGNARVTMVGGIVAAGSATPNTVMSAAPDYLSSGVFAISNYIYDAVGAQNVAARGDTTGSFVVNKPAADSGTGLAPAATTAAASSLVVKGSAGNLYALNVTAGATAGFVMVFNATAAPADGAVTPSKCIPLAANTGIDLNWRAAPSYLSTGITVVFSSTGCFNKTASATAFISGDAK